MGVSFKVSKTGTRFKPKPCLQSEASVDAVPENSKDSSRPRKLQVSFLVTHLLLFVALSLSHTHTKVENLVDENSGFCFIQQILSLPFFKSILLKLHFFLGSILLELNDSFPEVFS